MSNTQKIEALLASPCTSYWLKDALRSAIARDPIDALCDAALIADLLRARAKEALSA